MKRKKTAPPAGQGSLFAEAPRPRRRKKWRTEYGRSRGNDPATAKDAAHSVKTAELELKVVETLAKAPDGLTSHEVAERLDVQLVSISPRFRPLVEKNLIRDSGEKRKGESGRFSIVWKLGGKAA
jgi:hypothetical protein